MIMPKNYTLQNASNLGWLFYKDYYRQEPNVDFISTQGKESDTTADFSENQSENHCLSIKFRITISCSIQQPFWYTIATKNHLSGFNNR